MILQVIYTYRQALTGFFGEKFLLDAFFVAVDYGKVLFGTPKTNGENVFWKWGNKRKGGKKSNQTSKSWVHFF